MRTWRRTQIIAFRYRATVVSGERPFQQVDRRQTDSGSSREEEFDSSIWQCTAWESGPVRTGDPAIEMPAQTGAQAKRPAGLYSKLRSACVLIANPGRTLEILRIKRSTKP